MDWGRALELNMRAALRQNRDRLHATANVVGTGVGYKFTGGQRTEQLAIVCSVTKKLPLDQLAESDRIPSFIDGVATDVVESGPFRALQARTERWRPAPGGVSIGHFAITAGTLGCVVRKNGTRMVLSNNHVLANSNDATIGDAIHQPGPYDGGGPGDVIAILHSFVPIRFSEQETDCPAAGWVARALNAVAQWVGSRSRLRAVRIQAEPNLVDAALACPTYDADVLDDILDVGAVAGVAEGILGMAIQKSGRTTGLTRGEILQVDATVDVSYGGDRVARFEDQLIAGPMSQGGDSGSAVLDEDRKLVGLLFAGSDTTTVLNRAQNVLSALGAEV